MPVFNPVGASAFTTAELSRLAVLCPGCGWHGPASSACVRPCAAVTCPRCQRPVEPAEKRSDGGRAWVPPRVPGPPA